jgi:hypothetical protein
MSDFAAARGVRVVLDTQRVPDAIDGILVQDGSLSHVLADLRPRAPQVFRACSDVFDFVLPPQLPGVVRAVVVASERIHRQVDAMAAHYEVVRLRQPIDTARFAPQGEIRERPRRAVLLGNYLHGRRRRLLEAAWGAAGVECVAIGAGGETRAQPEAAIRDADIVVGKARAVLDGMACGRAAYVFDVYGGDGWVTPERYPAMEADNFGGHATDWTLSAERLAADLAAYRPEMGLVNRDLVLQHHSARDHAQQLVALMRRVTATPPAPIAPLRELARMVRALCAAELDAYGLRAALTQQAEAQHAAEARARDAEALEVERDALAARLAEVEPEAIRLRALLGTRRARAGLAAGRVADRVRGR